MKLILLAIIGFTLFGCKSNVEKCETKGGYYWEDGKCYPYGDMYEDTICSNKEL